MVYLNNKNLKEKNIQWSFGLNTAFFFCILEKFSFILLYDKLTLNLRGEGGGIYMYLALGQKGIFKITYLCHFWQGYKAMFLTESFL